MKFLPDGLPYPNIVIEVAVNHESPQKLLDYADRYFSAMSSVRIWIGVKVWVAGENFWCGWGERASGGTGATIHTTMPWSSNHHSIHNPVNTIYQIPMNKIYGPGIQLPPNAPNTLDINVDDIRQEILDVLT